MEKILKIEEVTDDNTPKWLADGFTITTDKQVIKLLIGNGQSCCESWGYFMSEDDLEQFIGADLLDVNLTDTALNTKQIEKNKDNIDCGGVMFVNLDTSKGLLQFVAYNVHNDYYGHDAYVFSEQLTHIECL